MPRLKSNRKTAKRQILSGKVDFLSLCPLGANMLSTLYKSDDGNKKVELASISKEMSEQGELICCVYAPDMTDSQGDTASAEVIKSFAYDYAQNGGSLDINHNEKTLSNEDILVAESTIIQKGDPRFADMKDYEGYDVDVTGGWGVILKVESEDLRKFYRDGDWNGISMGGVAIVKDVEDVSIVKALKVFFSDLMNKSKSNTNKLENDMDLTDKNLADIAKAVLVAGSPTAQPFFEQISPSQTPPSPP